MRLSLLLILALLLLAPAYGKEASRPRVIVSTDIGGTDPDDLQSLVHLLVYADSLDLEGLISSPFGPGRKQHILDVIDLYEKDYPNLQLHSKRYPKPGKLRQISQQGATEVAPYEGFAKATKGSKWIVKRARAKDPRPLHILVWGGLEDLAQALHDAPDILPKLRVYFIGGPNKKWSPNAYQYLFSQHPKLSIIEANATYRGWFVGGDQTGEWGNQTFVSQHLAGAGALGSYFATLLEGTLKMGDTPSVARLLEGDAANPASPGWGGEFIRAWARPQVSFNRLTSAKDTVEVFSIFELNVPLGNKHSANNQAAAKAKPSLKTPATGVYATMLIGNQQLEGNIDQQHNVRFRFSPKNVGVFEYRIHSNDASIDKKTGALTAVASSASAVSNPDVERPNWWTDNPDPKLAQGPHIGAKTVNRWRQDFLTDFANRMRRLKPAASMPTTGGQRPRVIVTSDGEIDDECSMVRFLLYANEWDIEGIITSSSQYHWQGHKWAGDDWVQPLLNAYAKVQPNLILHDANYPTAEFLQRRTLLGNVKAEGEMQEITPGSEHIVKVLLDPSDHRPIWLQAWGGTNTIARALKTIEVKHPEKMAYVANKIRFFFIWEQDPTYQEYIRPTWGKYKILTIISDQFWALAYQWNKILPAQKQTFFQSAWMKQNILENHGALCSLYSAHVKGSYGLADDFNFTPGDFRSEGDSPAFLHTIDTGLRNLESPQWGGWGGRYINVRDNTWLDPVPVAGYEYPQGRWYTGSAWGRNSMREGTKTTQAQRLRYFKPLWRWSEAMQNDFAARADWSVKPYQQANHPPRVKLAHSLNLKASAGSKVELSGKASTDPDGNRLHYHWWQYTEAGTYSGAVNIKRPKKPSTSFRVPKDAQPGETLHMILEVTDDGEPPLTRYQRVVVEIE